MSNEAPRRIGRANVATGEVTGYVREDIVEGLTEHLAWALSQIREPVRRIRGQNEVYFDSYTAARAALARASEET